MLTSYEIVADALCEIRQEFEKEITRWYRIARRADAHGAREKASAIRREIYIVEGDRDYGRYDNIGHYDFCFQIH